MRLNLEGNIWDLHIHTNECKSSDKSLKELSAKDYIDEVCSLLDDNPLVKMISFTDHNKISKTVYNEFYNRNTSVKLIPGIEIDVKFEDTKSSKHLLVYFDDEKDDFEDIANVVNELMREHDVSSSNPIDITTLLNKLVDKDLRFLLSAHAFKQRERGINSEWVGGDTNETAKKYNNQFFCFWETAGLSEIENAKQFLKDFSDNDISIVSFSDSKSIEGMRKYFKAPPIYFNSLPSFRGIQLAGTDFRRITKKQDKIDKINKSKLIGSIQVGKDKIELSNKLNTIIGGRGSGKSILLDSIALITGYRNDAQYEKRNEYIKNLKFKLRDMDGNPIKDSFNLKYFDQNYVSKIYASEDKNKMLEEYFSREFQDITDLNEEEKYQLIKNDFNDNFDEIKDESSDDINLGNITTAIVKLKDSNFNIKVSNSKMENKKEIIFDFNSQYNQMLKDKIIPKEFITNKNILKSIKRFQEDVLTEISKYNKNIIKTSFLNDVFIKEIHEYKKNQNEESKNKIKTSEEIERRMSSKINEYINRINIVNSVIKTTITNEFKYEESAEVKEEVLSDFKFKRELIIETPVEFFIRIFDDYVSKKKYQGEITVNNFKEVSKAYIMNIEIFVKDSKNIQEMYEELKALELIKDMNNKIYYNNIDIENESPGTQTNNLMEYILKQDSKIPLLIDQPEDNIDNRTIFNDLTNWISELKTRRQIILVTHDANITMNADAENVIIANQKNIGEFVYEYGALEYGNNLEQSSNILDGGVDAVKRRMLKYGDEKNSDNI